jgi:hypothetical protein
MRWLTSIFLVASSAIAVAHEINMIKCAISPIFRRMDFIGSPFRNLVDI